MGCFLEFARFWKVAHLVENTLSFGPIMTKLAPVFNFPKILTMIEYYWVAARFDGETAVQMAKKTANYPLFFFISL